MILTEHSVFARAGQVKGPWPQRYLVMCIEESLANKIGAAMRLDSALANYLFAFIFDDSQTCGESGIHQFISGLDMASPMLFAGYPNKMVPIRAYMFITLEEFDDLRIRRKGWEGKFKNSHPFPEYTKLEGGVRSQESIQ